MQCREARELLSPYLDGELDAATGDMVSAHLAGCPECRTEYNVLRELLNMFRGLPEVVPPSRISDRVINKIKLSSPPVRSTSRIAGIFRHLAGGRWHRAVALAAAVLVTAGITVLVYGPPGRWGGKDLILPGSTGYHNGSDINAPGGINGEEDGAATGGFSSGSEISYRSRIAGNIMPGRPAAGTAGGAEPSLAESRPGPSGTEAGPSRHATGLPEQFDNPPERRLRGSSLLPLQTGTAADNQSMAVRGKTIQQQAAFSSAFGAGAQQKKIVRSAAVSLDAADAGGVAARIADIAVKSGGYLLSEESGERIVAVSVPAERFEQAVDSIRELGHAAVQRIDEEDVTQIYYACEARLQELAAEEQRLLGEPVGADSASDGVQAAEVQLARVRQELELQKKLLGSLSSKTRYATIKVYLQ
ncbi:MAG: DUF4349 domain-containing protein [Pelotomaculum sp.]|nr:DUF4349 domain-containing protein [Pelotomaculum sp.]